MCHYFSDFFQKMRIFALVGFLVLFFLDGILIFGNADYRGDFYFLKPFFDEKLAIGFLGFSLLGFFIGIFFHAAIFLFFRKKSQKKVDETPKKK